MWTNDEATQTPVEPTAAPQPVAAPKKAKAPKTAKAKKAPAKKAKGKSTANGVKGPAVLRKYAPQYHKDNEKKTAGGNTSVDCNDPTAAKLRSKTLDEVYAIAAKTLKEPEADLRRKYKNLNVGMQRMNLGNRIRHA